MSDRAAPLPSATHSVQAAVAVVHTAAGGVVERGCCGAHTRTAKRAADKVRMGRKISGDAIGARKRTRRHWAESRTPERFLLRLRPTADHAHFGRIFPSSFGRNRHVALR